MTVLEKARHVLNEHGRIAKTADFLLAGVSATQLGLLCRQGHIQRIQHGWYGDGQRQYVPDEQRLAALLPEAIVCMESALFQYGYSDFSPQQWCVAVPRSFSSRRLKTDLIAIRPYYVSPHVYELGATKAVINGVSLRIYDRERTICDCFKYKARLDKEMFNTALRQYVKDADNNIHNLLSYVKKMKLSTSFYEIMGVLLHE